MEICHRLAVNRLTNLQLYSYILNNQLKHIKVPLPGNPTSLIAIDIMEDSPHWEIISKMIAKNPVSDIWETFFTDEEVLSCEWVRLCVVYEKDYHIIKRFDWRQQNFQDLCPRCGSFIGQNKPYEFLRKGKLNKDLNILGGTDDIITSTQHIDMLSEAGFTGFEVWPVFFKKDKTTLDDIHQIYIRTTTPFEGLLETEKFHPKVCDVCNRKKFLPHLHGWMLMKREVFSGMPDMVSSYELFGSGGVAFRETIISNRVARFLLQNKWSGFRLKGIKLF